MIRHGIISGNTVINVIDYAQNYNAVTPPGFTAPIIAIPSPVVNVGDTWDGTTFIPQPIPPYTPPGR